MKEKIQYFEDIEFDESKVGSMTDDLINLAYDEGKEQLKGQVEVMNNTWRNANSIIGWLIAIVVALVGVLAAQIGSMTCGKSFVVTLTALIVFAIPMFVLIYGVSFKREFFHSGDSPSHFLRGEVLDALRNTDNNHKIKYVKGWYLWELQYRYMENKKEQKRSVGYYRFALLWIAIGVSLLLIIAAVPW